MTKPTADRPRNPRASAKARGAAFAMTLLFAALAGPGCGREFFREWGDQDVSEAVFEKSRDPRWRLDTFSIEPPALSRFADPYDPDRPPAPPDDYATERLSPVPQWPHHRLLTPVEGTGYLDMLNAWRDRKPAARRSRPAWRARRTPSPDASLADPRRRLRPVPGQSGGDFGAEGRGDDA